MALHRSLADEQGEVYCPICQSHPFCGFCQIAQGNQNKQAEKCGRTIDVLLQIHVAKEETKFGFTPEEVVQMLAEEEWKTCSHVRIVGLMAMATNTDNEVQITDEFETVRQLSDTLKERFFADEPSFKEISMGMSGDYLIAQEYGSTMVRIGSQIFGERIYTK